MEIVFNDAAELQIQSAGTQADGSLLIKVISVSEDELKTLFSDSFATAKMTVKERGQEIAVYEKYTTLNAIVKYTAGILGVVLFKKGETQEEKLSAMEEENAELKKTVDMLQGCILEMSELVYQ